MRNTKTKHDQQNEQDLQVKTPEKVTEPKSPITSRDDKKLVSLNVDVALPAPKVPAQIHKFNIMIVGRSTDLWKAKFYLT